MNHQELANPWQERTKRLVGSRGLDALKHATVTVFGLGGVGSYCVEALARSSIGTLVIVDHDTISDSNRNRQLHATASTRGLPKTAVLEQRIHDIDPNITVHAHQAFFSEETASRLLSAPTSFVVDAIDSLGPKVHLLHKCVQMGIPVVSSMGAASRLDPTQVRIAPLAQTQGDPFAAHVRKRLRRRCELDGILAVHSTEPPLEPPQDLPHDLPKMTDDICRGRQRIIQPSMVMVPAAMGLAAASVVIRHLTHSSQEIAFF